MNPQSKLSELVIIDPSSLAKMAGEFLIGGKSILQKHSTDHRHVAVFEAQEAAQFIANMTSFNFQNKSDALLELLARFELIYYIDSASLYFVPSWLLDKKSDKEEVRLDGVVKKRAMKFRWMFPIGLFHRLMIRVLNFYNAEESFHDYLPWKKGIILSWSPKKSIRLEEVDLELQITVQGTDTVWVDKRMQDVLHISQEMISSNFPGLH